MEDAPLSDLSIRSSINTDNQLMGFSDSTWQDYPDTGQSTGAFIIFYQGGIIYHDTHVPVPVAQSISESEYNTACTAGMVLAHFRVLFNELVNKDPYIFPEEATLIILDGKSDVCMANNGKDTNLIRNIYRRVYV